MMCRETSAVWIKFGFFILFGWLLCACSTSQPELTLGKEEDRFKLYQEGDLLVAKIESVSGIGHAILDLPVGSSYPGFSGLRIELDVNSLEYMQVATEYSERRFSLLRGDRYPTPWSHRERTGAALKWQAWQPFGVAQGLQVDRGQQGVWILLPGDWLEGQAKLRLEWIDWYR